MNLSVRDLRAFLYVAELGSFTRAAEQMHITQAGLSSMIRGLERSLDCRLFIRTTRHVALTESGRVFLPVATQVLAELNSVEDRLRSLNEGDEARIRIGATPLVCSTFLPKLCQELRLVKPDVRIEVFEIPFDEIPDEVESGTVDIGLCADLFQSAPVQHHPIFSISLVWISKHGDGDHEARDPEAGETAVPRIERIRWADLPDVPLIALRQNDPFQRLVDKHLAKIGRCEGPPLTVGSVETQIAMVRAGFGGAIVPSVALGEEMRDLRACLLVDPTSSLDYCGLTKAGRALSDTMSVLLDIARRELPHRFEIAMSG